MSAVTNRKQLIHLLRTVAASPKGVQRSRLLECTHDMTAREINRIRDNDWLERGLKSLIHEELLPNHRNRPSTRWFITSAGRDFLRRYLVNPLALPNVSVGRQPYQSLEAKLYAQRKQRKQQRRRRNQRKYYARLQNPKYTAATYDVPYDFTRLPAIGTPAFRKLDNLFQIRAFRTRVRRRQLENRFAAIVKQP